MHDLRDLACAASAARSGKSRPLGLTRDIRAVALARHWYGAGEAEKTLTSAWQAAAEAASALAYPEQLQMLKLALDVWSHIDDPAAAIGAPRTRVLELAADAACWAAEAEQGLAFVDAALAELDEKRAGEQVAALLLQRAMMRQQGLLAGEIEDLQRALGLAANPTRLRAETLGQLCRALILRDDGLEARPFGDELRGLADSLDDEEYKIEAALVRAHLETADDNARIDVFICALERAKRAANGRLEVLASAGLLQTLLDAGEYARAIEIGPAIFRRTVELGQARYMGATIGAPLCRSLLALGRIADAAETCERMTALDPLSLGLVLVLECRAEIASLLGEADRVSDAVRAIRSMPAGPQAASRRRASLLRLDMERHAAAGELDQALALAETVPLIFDRPQRFLWPLLVSAIRIAVDAGQKELAQLLADLATAMPLQDAVSHAESLTFKAEMSRAMTSNVAAWETAADAWTTLNQPLRQAYALMRSGAAAINGGKRARGADHFRRSAEIAENVGAQVLLDQIEAMAVRARVRLRAGEDRIELKAPLGLTERELEVLRLVAAGRSNRQIAADLFISSKTASVHVSNILSKLAVPTRGAAAAMAHRLQIVGPI